jgi:hypothetical protein
MRGASGQWRAHVTHRIRAAAAAALVGLVVAATPASALTPSGPRTVAARNVVPPPSLYLFYASGFRFQDPNPYACTSTNAMDMLNFIALAGRGGGGFGWRVDVRGSTRDAILAWERTHDTLAGGNGSDPHGWRNALNAYGWGEDALLAGRRVYDDFAFTTYDAAVKSAVRSMALYRKPVGVLAWAGAHAEMLVGYYGLSGDPFEKDSFGRYTDAFTVGGFYLADPLQSQGFVNVRVPYLTFKTTPNLKLRFRAYLQTDSPYDDPYTPGTKPARDEWYGKFVTIAPVR